MKESGAVEHGRGKQRKEGEGNCPRLEIEKGSWCGEKTTYGFGEIVIGGKSDLVADAFAETAAFNGVGLGP